MKHHTFNMGKKAQYFQGVQIKNMASENKRRKEKNCKSYHGFALKEKGTKIKRLLYFNSSQRRLNNKILALSKL